MKKEEEKVHTAISNYLKLQYPNVYFTSESSGIRVPMGIAKQMKAQRSKHKQLDMIILEPRGGYHGLVLEIKKDFKEVYLKNGEISKRQHIQEQLGSIKFLIEKGYFSAFVCGFNDAKLIIDTYMDSYFDSNIQQLTK